ncbi:MAG: hypothetical protein GC161_04370 [Planctomycetaceae bacterium]|nr:hypothetical protein [Planctomycetaceae bacterium]
MFAVVALLGGTQVAAQGAAEDLWREALRLIEAKQQGEAVRLLEERMRDAPQDGEALRLLGHAQFELDPAAARRAFAQSVVRGYFAPSTLSAMATLDRERGRAGAALWALDMLAWLEPEVDPAQLVRVQLLDELGRADEAIALGETYVRDNPGAVSGWRVLGALQQRRGDIDAAIVSLSTAYALHPAQDDVARQLAALHQLGGNANRALEWYLRDASRATVHGVTSDLEHARMLLAADAPERAAALLRGLPPSDVASGEVQALLGHAALRAGDGDAAIAAWRAAAATGVVDGATLVHVVAADLDAGRRAKLAEIVPRLDVWDQHDGGGRDTRVTQLLVLGHLSLGQRAEASSAIRRRVARLGLDGVSRDLLRQLHASAGQVP